MRLIFFYFLILFISCAPDPKKKSMRKKCVEKELVDTCNFCKAEVFYVQPLNIAFEPKWVINFPVVIPFFNLMEREGVLHAQRKDSLYKVDRQLYYNLADQQGYFLLLSDLLVTKGVKIIDSLESNIVMFEDKN